MANDEQLPVPPSQTPQPQPKIEPTSSFYLGPQDRPGDFITPTHFTGNNYDDWVADIQTALEARRKFVFLNGTITGPTLPCSQSDWTTINAMLISWLMNTIDPEVERSLAKYRDAKKLWDTLKNRFAVTIGPRIQQLKSSIAKCEQSKNMSVSTYFGQLSMLWEELHTHEPIITCSCCVSCNASNEHEARRENNKLHQFLMGLCIEYYAQVRTNILSKDPLPSLDRAYQMVLQEETIHSAKVSEDKSPEVMSFAVKTGSGRGHGRFDKPDKSHLSCTHCKKSGHDVSQCFEIHGYPEWYENRGNNARGGRSGRGRGVPRANPTLTNKFTDKCGVSSSHLFSADQWKALTGLISGTKVSDDQLNGKFDTRLWIIDTGASRHVTGDSTRMTNAKDIFHCPVGLPNGKTVVATQEGSVRLTDKITFNHVLYVPSLSCNLISVSQLNDDMQSSVHFNSYMCAIQDQSREMIGAGVRRDGLYYFKGTDSVQHLTVNGVTTWVDLWHQRMGHPSEKVMKLLPSVSIGARSFNKACETSIFLWCTLFLNYNR
nr:Retrovirus-related Pol polyprotein from transposon RE2 [Ipomoea batatas]